MEILTPKAVTPRSRGAIDNAFGFLFREAKAIANVGEIQRGARLITFFGRRLRTAPHQSMLQTPDGRIDLAGNARRLGLSIDAFRDRLDRQQSKTALNAYVAIATGCAALVYWMIAAMRMPHPSSRLLSLAIVLLFEIVMGLIGFENAWINWQIRTLRAGPPGAYLRTSDPFWPR